MSSSHNNDNDSLLCTSKNGKCKAIVFAGPTASGKSALALKLAERINGVVVNADSMQVYEDVPTLTARPSEQETEKVEHKLYGFLSCYDKFSVSDWIDEAARVTGEIASAGKVPVFAGGTGMYLQTLEEGISPLPDIPDEIRSKVRERFNQIGYEAFLSEFVQKDPLVRLTDPQRLIRAAEVFETTGKSIVYWQSLPFEKRVKADFFNILVSPPREVLYERCDARFDKMMENGAVEEVEALLLKNPPPDALVMKALGVREIQSWLNGETTREEAVMRAQQMTRNYAKRQTTWFKHRFKADLTLFDGNFDTILTNVLRFLS